MGRHRDLRRRWHGPIVLRVRQRRGRRHRGKHRHRCGQVSNHGGRQLDHMASPLDVLQEIVERVDGGESSSTAASGAGPTSSRRSRWVQTPVRSVGLPLRTRGGGRSRGLHVVRLLTEEMTRTLMLLGVSSIKNSATVDGRWSATAIPVGRHRTRSRAGSPASGRSRH